MNHEGDRLLAGLRKLSVPAGFKEQVLSAAAEVEVEVEPRASRRLEDRLWESSTLRLAWLGVTALLLAVNLFLARPAPTVVAGRSATESTPESEALDAQPGFEDPHLIAIISRHRPRRWTLAEAAPQVDRALQVYGDDDESNENGDNT
ncbi:MAG: hypothetical protein ACC742_16690 [Thermoanaerobaculales bacterium]